MKYETTPKIRGNAMSAYLLFLLCAGFLINKDPNIGHPFVKNHTRIALTLHILFLLMLWIMSYPFLDGIHVLSLSVNTIITMGLSFLLFAALIFGALRAYQGKTLSFGEIFEAGGAQKQLLSQQSSSEVAEENIALLIIAHIPFLGCIISGKYKKLQHMHDIITLNIVVSLIMSLFFVTGLSSLASIILLIYIIWASFVSLRLVSTKEISTLNLGAIPSGTEMYIHFKTFFSYLTHLLHSDKKFASYKKIYSQKAQAYTQKIQEKKSHIEKFPHLKIPHILVYIPVINLLGVFFVHTKQRYHIYNGLMITLLYILILLVFGWSSKLPIFLLFPIFFGIGYLGAHSYLMPFISDIWSMLAGIWYTLTHIFHRGKELHKTVKEEKIVIENNEEEAKTADKKTQE